MSTHERPVGASVEWFTPPSLFEALGLGFDLDPASPASGPVPWVPAIRFFSSLDDGTRQPWVGRVWLNPPYGAFFVPFVDRMIEHDDGLLLIASRTETRAFQRAARTARSVTFLADRLWHVRPDGSTGRSSFGSALLAFGHRYPTVERLGWTP